MKYLMILSIALFSVLTDHKAPQTQYEYENGIFTDSFVAWHANGTKKAEGNFASNQKVGTWSIWDSEGQLLMTKEYSNSFEFKIIATYSTNGKKVDFPKRETYNLTPNKEGFISYPKVLEENVVWLTRIWRILEPSDMNSIFFEKNRLFNVLQSAITSNKDISAYLSEEMKTPLSADELNEIFDHPDLKIEAFKLKEECFYNKELQMTETRILGICPVAENGKDLFWLYYPQLRSFLAKNEVESTTDFIPIKNLDDVFLYRQFNSMIYKKSNVMDQEISAYASGDEVKTESERIEIDLLQMELDTWINSLEIK